VTVLLDPAVAIPASDPSVDLPAFWDSFVDWNEDERICLGFLSYQLVAEWCATTIWGSEKSAIPRFLERDLGRVFGTLLNRVPLTHGVEAEASSFAPPHEAPADLAMALFADLTSLLPLHQVSIASSPSFWPASTEIVFSPASPLAIQLLFEPNQPTIPEKESLVRSQFLDKSILIIGGQRLERIEKAVHESTGVPSTSIRWLSSEPHRVPTHLDAVLDSFHPDTHHLVFVWGQVGHATFEKVQARAAATSYELIQARFASQIVDQIGERGARDASAGS